MTLAVENATSTHINGSSSGTITVNTSGTNRVCYLVISAEQNSNSACPSVTSVTSSHATWTQVFSTQQVMSGQFNGKMDVEVWQAYAASALSSEVVTVDYSNNTDGGTVSYIAISGCPITSSPFSDPNGSLPAFDLKAATSTQCAITFSTNNADNVLIEWCVAANSGGPPTISSGFTSQVAINDHSPSTWDNEVSLATKIVSSTQSSVTANMGDTNPSADCLMIMFSVTGDTPPTPSGTWASTEGTDTMSFAGGVLGGHWSSTDAQDTFHAASTAGGPWASTDSKDTMAFVGYPKLTGTWASTETKDAFAASAFETPPLALDGHASAGVNGPVSSGTVTLSTTQANDVIVLTVSMGGFFNASLVSTVTDTAGLTWHKRNQRWQSGGNMSTEGAGYGDGLVNQGLDMEVWWAHAPTALTNDVITVTPVAEVGAMALIAFGVSGANYTTPWDTHAQAGGYTDQIGNRAFFPAQSQLYTNANKTFLFGIHGDFTADAGVVQTPWIYTTTAQGSEHNGFTPFESFAYQIVDTPQLSTDVPFGFSYAGGFVYASQGVMFDSIVAADEDGTAESTVWFLDPSSVNGTISLTTNNELVLNYSAVNFNLMVLIQVLIQSASGTGEVTSIDESQGLLQSGYHFTRRSRVVEGTLATEIWWGWVPPGNTATGRPNNDTITINTTGTTTGDVISAQMWGIGGTTGSYGLGDPFWDGNPSVPATNQSAGSTPPPNVTEISTDTPSCLLVAWTANITEQEPGYVNPFVTLVQHAPATVLPIMQFNSSAPPAYMGFEYFYEPGLAANETAEFLVSPEPVGWMMIGDAIPVGPPQPPTGVLAATEHKDSFTNSGAFDEIWTSAGWIGYVPAHAAWASTEHPDENTNAGRWTALGWVTGWIGFLSLFTTWHSTDARDVATFYTWLLGFGGITGQIVATENKDRLSFSNAATVTGKLQTTESKDRLSANAFLIPKARPAVPPKRRLLIVT